MTGDTYREDAREKRRVVIAFRTSWVRIAGPIFGVLVGVPMICVWLLLTEREVRVRCTRDEHGNGACEHVVRYAARTTHETFDVRAVRGARVVIGRGKSGPTYRSYLNVDGLERPLGEVSDADGEIAFADAIDRFARATSAGTIDVAYASPFQFGLMTLFTLMFAGFGVLIVVGTRRLEGPRRLVFDEIANVATLEQKVALRWKKRWAVELAAVRGARYERDAKGFISIVIDTNDDGALVADPAVAEDDPTVAEITRFLEGR